MRKDTLENLKVVLKILIYVSSNHASRGKNTKMNSQFVVLVSVSCLSHVTLSPEQPPCLLMKCSLTLDNPRVRFIATPHEADHELHW